MRTTTRTPRANSSIGLLLMAVIIALGCSECGRTEPVANGDGKCPVFVAFNGHLYVPTPRRATDGQIVVGRRLGIGRATACRSGTEAEGAKDVTVVVRAIAGITPDDAIFVEPGIGRSVRSSGGRLK